jgi:hypothetical protein
MARVTLHIPLHLTPEHGFFNPSQALPQTLFGFAARFKIDPVSDSLQLHRGLVPYPYLVLENVPLARVKAVFERARRCLTWASVRLNMGILTDRDSPKHTDKGIFNGQFATTYPAEMAARPIRAEGSHRGEEPSTRLFAALTEGADKTKLAKPKVKGSLLLACELFATADFEATANSQFLMLTAVFEVLAEPKKRPKACVSLVKNLIDTAKKSEGGAVARGNNKMKEAFKALQDSAFHLKEESITSSVRKLATRASQALGDAEPEKAGKRAAALYGKRNHLVHKGKSVTWGDVNDLRALVRETLAVEAGCYDRIRERGGARIPRSMSSW